MILSTVLVLVTLSKSGLPCLPTSLERSVNPTLGFCLTISCTDFAIPRAALWRYRSGDERLFIQHLMKLGVKSNGIWALSTRGRAREKTEKPQNRRCGEEVLAKRDSGVRQVNPGSSQTGHVPSTTTRKKSWNGARPVCDTEEVK